MKELHKFCVRVTTDYEKHVALEFYAGATGYPIVERAYNTGGGPTWVGVQYYSGRFRQTITCGGPDGEEQLVEFANIETLADTPERKKALDAARAKVRNPNPDGEI